MAARIVFIGDPLAPGEDPAIIEIAGILFPLGEAVDVSDEALAAKLARHSHFAVEMAVPAATERHPDEAWVLPEAIEPGSSAYLDPATEMPIKRRPGRPRKNP